MDEVELLPPAFELTVPMALWRAVAVATREAFADSYLWGAILDGNKLFPRTSIAHDEMAKSYACKTALKGLGIELVDIKPFDGIPGKGDRPDKPDSLGRPFGRDARPYRA